MTKHSNRYPFFWLSQEVLEQHLYSEKLEPVEHFDDDVVRTLSPYREIDKKVRDAWYTFRERFESNIKKQPATKKTVRTL